MKVTNELRVYEVNGQEPKWEYPPRPALVIESHWSNRDMVVLTVSEGNSFTLVAADLEMAIRNATNCRR